MMTVGTQLTPRITSTVIHSQSIIGLFDRIIWYFCCVRLYVMRITGGSTTHSSQASLRRYAARQTAQPLAIVQSRTALIHDEAMSWSIRPPNSEAVSWPIRPPNSAENRPYLPLITLTNTRKTAEK